MEAFQRPQNISRLIFEVATVFRTVVRLGKTDIAHAGQQSFDAGRHLPTGERSADAGVRAATESEVLLDPRPVHVETFGIGEALRIAVGRHV